MTDPIPSSIQSLIALFSEELAEVHFPSVDAEVLRRAAGEVQELALTVAHAEAALEAARAALGEGQEALLGKAQRALAYARIYAEGDSALGARLETIVLPRAARRATGSPGEAGAEASAPAPRRGRPRKEASAPVLFASPEPASVAAAG